MYYSMPASRWPELDSLSLRRKCQFGEDIAAKTYLNDATFPSVGVGVAKRGSLGVDRLGHKGKSDNGALYLRFGHSF